MLPLACLGLTIGLWSTDVALIDRIIGAVAGYGALLGISGGYRLFRGRDGLGLGDVKLLGALGGWFGWQALRFILLFAASLGLLRVLVSMAAVRVVEAETRLQLGIFLSVAAMPGWLIVLDQLPGGG